MRVLKIVFCLCFIYTSCIGQEWTLQESVDYWCLDDDIVADYYVDWWDCEDHLYWGCTDWETSIYWTAEECVDETHYAQAALDEPWTLQESVDYWCLDDAIVFDYYVDQWDCDDQLYWPCENWEYDGWWSAEECVDETHYAQLGFAVWTLQESVDWWCLDESIISKYYIDWNDCQTYLTNECEYWEFSIYWSAEECVDETHFAWIEWFDDDDSDVWTLEQSIDYWCDDDEILDTFYPSGYADCYDFFDTACFNWEYDLIYTSAETCVDETHFDFAKVVDGTSSGAAQLTQSNSDVELPGSWSALGAGLDGFFGNGDVLKSFYLGFWLTCFIFKM